MTFLMCVLQKILWVLIRTASIRVKIRKYDAYPCKPHFSLWKWDINMIEIGLYFQKKNKKQQILVMSKFFL